MGRAFVRTRITLSAGSRVANGARPRSLPRPAAAASVLLSWYRLTRMEVRDAVESDAEALAGIAEAPTDVMRNVIHDRTVRVASDGEATDRDESVAGRGDGESGTGDRDDASDGDDVAGFVSFDAREDSVHITQFGGTSEVYGLLLAEPARFAEKEGMSVEMLVDAGDDSRRSALEAAGFTYEGPGPTFEGRETVRYRQTPQQGTGTSEQSI